MQDYINSISVFCEMRHDGRLNKLGNEFVDEVIQHDTDLFMNIAKDPLDIIVSRDICPDFDG